MLFTKLDEMNIRYGKVDWLNLVEIHDIYDNDDREAVIRFLNSVGKEVPTLDTMRKWKVDNWKVTLQNEDF